MITLGWAKKEWQYRKSHILQFAAGAGSGYQVVITVHYGSGTDSDENVYLDEMCNSDFSDIRFTSGLGEDLSYCIVSKIDGSQAVVWVKIDDDLSVENATFHIYYGNPSALSESDGEQVFEFFEDFESGALDGWTSGPDQNWAITTDGLSGTYAATNTNIDDDQTASILQSISLSSGSRIKFFAKVSSEEDYDKLKFFVNSVELLSISGQVGWTEYQYDLTSGTKELKWSYIKDGSVSDNDDAGYVDFIFVRKFVSVEPAHGEWGAEEQVSFEARFGAGLTSNLMVKFDTPEIIINPTANGSFFSGVSVAQPEITFSGNAGAALGVEIKTDGIIFTSGVESSHSVCISAGEIPFLCDLYCEIFSGVFIIQPPINFIVSSPSRPLLGISTNVIQFNAAAENQNISISIGDNEVSFVAGYSPDASCVVFNTDSAIIRYLFTLTGSADGLSDVEIPISSFQTRMRSGEPTYLQLVIPGLDFSDEISNRQNGNLRIDLAYVQNGVLLQREKIVWVDLETVRLDDGESSKSITLAGHKTTTFIPKTLTLDTSIYRSVRGGKITHRLARPNIYLRPGDTVNIGEDSFTVELVFYSISVDSQTMEITEA